MGGHLRLRFAPLVVVGLIGSVGQASAQALMPHPVAREVSVRGGRIEGTVTDEDGSAIDGVSIVAMGAALASARTDRSGRFALPLPQGEYVLRATREGYVSTYREPVRVQSDALLRRHITLTKAAPPPQVVLAGADVPASVKPATDEPAASLPADTSSESSQTDAAWRLRHLPRTVLRDVAPAAIVAADRPQPFDRSSIMDWIVASSARAANAVIGDTDFNGQLNFLTTSAMPATGVSSSTQPDWPRGIAYVVVGAPVGSYGDWSLRAATAAASQSSWTLLTEYHARPDRTHAFKTGVAYSAQEYLVPQGPLGIEGGRRVGGVYAADRWTLNRDAMLDYGIKVDRYDYLSDPALVSSHLAAKLALLPRTRLLMAASSTMIAPGADQFLPPTAAGVWLPPERTFSALRSGASLTPERVRNYEAGIETDLGNSRVLSLRHFTQDSVNQIATLFGLDAVSQVGHYYVSSPGNMHVEGWVLAASGQIVEHVRGQLSYSMMQTDWTPAARLGALRRVSPSSIRASGRGGRELVASLDADLPVSNTKVSLSARLSNEFSASNRAEWLPVVGGRFKIEIQQRLPYQPVRGSELNFVIAVRTLMRDLGDEGSLYDELLTVRPPLRLTSGVQMRF